MATILRTPVVTRIARAAFVAAAICSVSDVWQNNLLTTLTNRNTVFRPPLVTRIAPSTFSSAAIFSNSSAWSNPLLTTLERPFNQTDWPVPRGPTYLTANLTFVDSVKLNLQGKDQFYGLGGSPQFDWPVPKGPIFSGDSRTFTNRLATPTYTAPTSYAFRPPLITRYASEIVNYRPESFWPPNLLARVLPASKPTFQTDWQNPRGYVFPVDLRTFVNNVEIQLISKDLFFGAAGQGPSYTWPNPRGATYPLDLRTWISDSLEEELFVALGTGAVFRTPLITRYTPPPLVFEVTPLGGVLFGLDDPPGKVEAQPPVRARIIQEHEVGWPNLLATTLTPQSINVPFNRDWPNPLVTKEPWLYGWTVNPLNTALQTAQGVPAVPRDWPNPRGAQYSIALNTWVVNLLQNTIYPGPGPSVIPLNWPNPRGYIPSISLKTFIDPLKIVLQGKDLFFGAAGQPPSYDWPNPQGLTVARWNLVAILPTQGQVPLEEEAPVVFTSYGGPFLYTAPNWGYGSFYLEVFMRATAGTITARLYNETTTSVVTNSAITTSNVAFTRVRSGAFTLTNGSVYRLQFGKSGLDSGEALSGRLVVF